MSRILMSIPAFLVACGFLNTSVASAQGVIYDNFGPGLGWDPTKATAINATAPDLANIFTTPSAGAYPLQLQSITLAVTPEFPHHQIDVWLMSDAGGVPGTIIESFQFSNADSPLPIPLTAVSTLHPLLQAGTSYWVDASVDQYVTIADVYGSWFYNTSGDTGLSAYREGTRWIVGTGVARGAFRVEVEPIPEPAALALIAFGLLGLARGQWWDVIAKRGHK